MDALDWLLEFFGMRTTPHQDYTVFKVKPCSECQGESKCADCDGKGWQPSLRRRRGCITCLGSGRGECCVNNYGNR